MMRRPLVLLAILLATSCASRPGTATKYRPMNLFGGYKDEVVEPGVWRVVARSNGIAEAQFGMNMAVYRAADVIKTAGFPYMQVINQKGFASFIGLNGRADHSSGEWFELYVRGANDASPPSDCRAKDPKACLTLPVEQVMTRIRPLLTFPKDGS